MNLGKCIAASRKKIKMSSLELAERLNKSQPAVQAWESGRSMPATQDLPKLCDVLGITLDELFGRVATHEPGGDESVVLNAFRKLDDGGRAVVLTLLLRLSQEEVNESTLQRRQGYVEEGGRKDDEG